jgi:4-hydroxy-2-oxoheptanedioate aldolase
VANGTGTGNSGNITNVAVTCVTNTIPTFAVNVAVTGLTGSGLVLRNNGGNNLAVAANGSFAFSTLLASGAAYNVTVFTQPSTPSQTCTVTNPTGTIVRIPPNGAEKNQYFAKQALDRGVYGIVWPHISNAEEAYNAVASCRYPRPKNAPIYEPEGARGDAPLAATRYWGLPLKEYYKKADVWPLSPQGEILVFLMIEDTQGIANLDEILRTVPGVGCILIGEGDLSQELGVPREYEHPLVRSAMAQVVETCRKYKVPVGHPHVSSKNLEMVLAEGFQFLMSMPTRGYAVIEKARVLTGGAAARDSSNEVAVT